MFLSIDPIIQAALQEDLPFGDVTTECCVPETAYSHGYFLAKENFIVCGFPVLRRVFSLIDETVTVTFLAAEGQAVQKGSKIATIEGPARSVLTGERTALNFLQHLSGIATYTARAVDSISGTNARITDTRKTTPGLRILEKYAVRIGGGFNHRMGLSDGVLIKDNHIAAAGGIAAAVKTARQLASHMLKIEVETTNFTEIDQALQAKADIIMLDNMTNEQMRRAVLQIGRRALVEASGNMGDRNLRSVAETGVDLISIGALTHTIRAADISLNFI
ncbi:MAG: carboxylating nicotinate-nucleotide diphosphorylase [Oscillospiraceae bacterium]|nr:carboxylating nicotinate-nucleotide diphosphorylase [Oscillospiraceae bacterium]